MKPFPLSEKTEIGKYAPFFSLPNIKGEKITRSSEDLKKKNLLINFWASWTDSISNHQSNSELKELYQKYKKNKHIAMLGVSFDMDKKEWQDAIKRDTLNWEQVCDFGGLNSEVAKQYAIKEVPSNILLSADGKILAKNLKGEQLKKKIEEAVTAAEEKEKQDNKKKTIRFMPTLRWAARIAAAVIIAVSGYYMTTNYIYNKDAQPQTITVPAGQRAQITPCRRYTRMAQCSIHAYVCFRLRSQ